MAGGDASLVPASLDPNWINRKFEDLDQRLRELPASIMEAVTSLVTQANVPRSFHEITYAVPTTATDPVLSSVVTVPAGYNGAMAIVSVTGVLDLAFASGTKVFTGAIEVRNTGRPYSSNQISAPGGVVVISATELIALSDLEAGDTLTFKALTGAIASTTITTGTLALNGLVVFYRA